MHSGLDDTISAIATANGVGSISVIRVSGKNSLAIAKLLSKRDTFSPREATLCSLYDSNSNLLDQVIVIYFKAPFSFTGEDIVEFQLHGGVSLSQIVIKEIINSGLARYAQGGEFSKRAFLNGKIDLSQAEAIAKLIESKSEDASRILAKQMKGELKEFVDSIKDTLIEILAHIEVMIDYAEDELPSDILDSIEKKLLNITTTLNRTLDASRQREGLLNGFRLSIIGRPNVGKSSLLNKLLNYDRAIVSDIEGTTRDTIEESIKIGTHLIKIIDTAGIRDTSNEIEKIGIDRSLESINESDIILALFDSSSTLNSNDRKILDILTEVESKRVLIALNKSDLELKIDLDEFRDFDTLSVSCKNDLNPLIEKIKLILDSELDSSSDMMLISNRQVDAVRECLDSIITAKELLLNQEMEIFAFELNEAIKSISSITRPYEYSQMLDKMFGEFCLGK
jgi:tRNA modification GTPase